VNLHRVGRLAWVLSASQSRSGRSTSDPRSLLGQPSFLAVLDVIGFVVPFLFVEQILSGLSSGRAAEAYVVGIVGPFLPLYAVASVALAGVLFELTTSARFAASDAANWLPVTPAEYVAASALAIAWTYAPVLAVALGLVTPLAIGGGAVPTLVFAAALSVLGLVEGGLLVEMVRATAQRTGSISVRGHGRLTLFLRLALLVLLVLVLDLALNPIFLFDFFERFSSYLTLLSAVPLFWSTLALSLWSAGAPGLAAAVAAGQVAFVALLLWGAARLRRRYWVPSTGELSIASRPGGGDHRLLRSLGLSPPEAAITAKDLRGLVRRREMMPILAIPIVLAILLVVESSTVTGFAALLWGGWVVALFALLLATRSLGQERRAVIHLYIYPVPPRSVFRAKAAYVVLPSVVTAVVLVGLVGAALGLGPAALAAYVALNAANAVVLGLWGLVFASRYSDFQDRPRPRDLATGATLVALGSGSLLVFGTLLPAGLLLSGLGGPARGWLVAWVVGLLLAAGLGAYAAARLGFERLLRQLPN
jgi:hypothetical protein